MLSLKLFKFEIREPYHETLMTWVRHCVKFSKKIRCCPKHSMLFFSDIAALKSKLYNFTTDRSCRIVVVVNQLIQEFASQLARGRKILLPLLMSINYFACHIRNLSQLRGTKQNKIVRHRPEV